MDDDDDDFEDPLQSESVILSNSKMITPENKIIRQSPTFSTPMKKPIQIVLL